MRFRDLIWVVLVVLIGLALRLDYLFAGGAHVDADEAIVGLMGKHILESFEVPTFYYGQHYMGSFEPMLAAVSFALFGESDLALKMVPLLFSLILIGLMYSLGRVLGGVWLGRVASLLTAIPPPTLLVWSLKARGGFIEILVLGVIALLLLVRWINEPKVFRTFLIGVVLGFGWWVNNQIIYFMLPVGFVMLSTLFRGSALQTFRHFTTGLGGFVLGGFPFWVYNLRNSFVSFEMFSSSEGGQVSTQVLRFFDTALPVLLGARRYWGTQDIFLYSTILVGVIYLSLFVIVLSSRWTQIRQLIFFRVDRELPIEILILLAVAVLGVFSLSSFGHLAQAPRYLLPLYVALILLNSFALWIVSKSRPRVAILGVLSLVLLNISLSYSPSRAIPGTALIFEGQRAARDHDELIDWLRERGDKWVYTNYWIGYRLAFETSEEIRFQLFARPQSARIESYEKEGSAAGAHPYVLTPLQADHVIRGLEALGYNYQRAEVSDYSVLYDIHLSQQDLKPIELSRAWGQASLNNSNAAKAMDGKLDTRWGSGSPQSPGMWYSVEFEEARFIRGVGYSSENFKHDFPRGLLIQLEQENGERVDVLKPTALHPVRYFLGGPEERLFVFEPMKVKRVSLIQTGEDPIFDWSISEVFCYE